MCVCGMLTSSTCSTIVLHYLNFHCTIITKLVFTTPCERTHMRVCVCPCCQLPTEPLRFRITLSTQCSGSPKVTWMFLGTFSPSTPGMFVSVLDLGSSQKDTSQRMKMTRAFRKLSLVQYRASLVSGSLFTTT